MSEIYLEIENCINSLAEKFVRWPNNFFTESDAHSFLYSYIFRSKYNRLKQWYLTKDKKDKTVLIHREYPTNFRFRKEEEILDATGGRGHYDLVALNPDFIAEHTIEEIMAKDFKKCCQDNTPNLLSAIEFKFLVKPLDKGIKRKIAQDFSKLKFALDNNQAINVYLIIFNRYRKEIIYIDELHNLVKTNSSVKVLYIESITAGKREYRIFYSDNWLTKLKKYKFTLL